METDPETREHEPRTHIEKGLQDTVGKRPSEKKNRGTQAQKLRETQREAETDSRTGTQRERERAHRDTVRGRAEVWGGTSTAAWPGWELAHQLADPQVEVGGDRTVAEVAVRCPPQTRTQQQQQQQQGGLQGGRVST